MDKKKQGKKEEINMEFRVIFPSFSYLVKSYRTLKPQGLLEIVESLHFSDKENGAQRGELNWPR